LFYNPILSHEKHSYSITPKDMILSHSHYFLCCKNVHIKSQYSTELKSWYRTWTNGQFTN